MTQTWGNKWQKKWNQHKELHTKQTLTQEQQIELEQHIYRQKGGKTDRKSHKLSFANTPKYQTQMNSRPNKDTSSGKYSYKPMKTKTRNIQKQKKRNIHAQHVEKLPNHS